MKITQRFLIVLLVAIGAIVPHVRADERRAPAPEVDPDKLKNIFFTDINDAFRGQAPTIASVRATAAPAAPERRVEDVRVQGRLRRRVRARGGLRVRLAVAASPVVVPAGGARAAPPAAAAGGAASEGGAAGGRGGCGCSASRL